MNRRRSDIFAGKRKSYDILKMLWTNWQIGCGTFTLLLILSMLIPYIWLPVIAALQAVWLQKWRMPACRSTEDGQLTTAPLEICIRGLWASAVIMLAIEIFCTDFLIGKVVFLPLYNEEIPFVTCLVIFPVLAVCSAGWLIVKRRTRRPGDDIPARPILAMIPREAVYQVRMMLLLSVILGCVESWYYFTTYINSNFNAPDHFFFVFLPVGVYVISLIFMGGRYNSISGVMKMLYTLPSQKDTKLVRYLIFSDNDLVVKKNAFGFYDTPVEVVYKGEEELTQAALEGMFSEKTGVTKFKLRYLYSNSDMTSGIKILHYAVTLNGEESEEIKDFRGEEYRRVTMGEIRHLASCNELAPLLGAELVRIYAVTMAWKTYDREGKRLYPIRNYRPTFRFRDLWKWDVDYDDLTWLDIAEFNEDKRFYRLRKLFKRRKANVGKE